MSTKPFFSGRIPQSLYDALEEYRQKTNESKTDILIKALSNYVDHPIELSDSPQSCAVETSKIEVLGKKVKVLEEGLQAIRDLLATKLDKPVSEQLSSRTSKVEEETGQFLLTLKEDVIEPDNKADIDSVSNQNLVTILDNESDIHSQTSDNSKDNSDDNNQIEKLEQGSLTPKPSGILTKQPIEVIEEEIQDDEPDKTLPRFLEVETQGDDTKTDEGVKPDMTVKEVANFLGWTNDKVSSRHKRNQIFEEKGYRFTPTKQSGRRVWETKRLETQ